MHGRNHEEGSGHHSMHYKHLALMSVVSFVLMYALMYSMVDSFSNVYNSLNQVYMAGQMTAAMVLVELIFMKSMYTDKKKNTLILSGSIIALILFYAGTRAQTAITDKQFLRSMIPHHAGAVLMCNEAPIENEKIKDLCRNIISNQKTEIDQMKSILNEL